MQVTTAIRPLKGESCCGDAAGFWIADSTTILTVIDGLGHGEHAQTAALAAMDYVARHLKQPLPDLFSECSDAIRDTRGVAMAIAAIDEQTGMLTYAGIGNTRAMVLGERITRLSSNYGIVGFAYKKLTTERVQLSNNDLVFMFTDGLKENIDVSKYGDLLSIDLELLAGQALADCGLPRDDAAILIYRKGVA